MTTAPGRTREIDESRAGETKDEALPLWNVVVWNDPVNLMSYVVWVFRKLFGHPAELATKLMLQVHHEGRAIVATEPRETAELNAYRLHHHGLWATLERH
ncbi:MAG: ATP-dependent Clp protease adapter ClpS [Acidimicrobiia bacterium]